MILKLNIGESHKTTWYITFGLLSTFLEEEKNSIQQMENLI